MPARAAVLCCRASLRCALLTVTLTLACLKIAWHDNPAFKLLTVSSGQAHLRTLIPRRPVKANLGGSFSALAGATGGTEL